MDQTAPVVAVPGITAIAALLIASFAVDRVVAGLLFVLSFNEGFARSFPDPAAQADPAARASADRRRKLLYFVLAAVIALPLLAWYGKIRILAAVGFVTISPLLDRILTGIILVGGADRIAEVLKWGSSPVPPTSQKPQPIEITGKLILEEPSVRRGAMGAG